MNLPSYFITAVIISLVVPQANTQLSTSSDEASDVLDGIYIQQHIPTQKNLYYSRPQQSDIIWSKRVWRTIDLASLANRRLFSPENSTDNYQSMWDVILDCIETEGSITIYQPDTNFGDEFKFPISHEGNPTKNTVYQHAIKQLTTTTQLRSRLDKENQTILDQFGSNTYDTLVTKISSDDIIEYRIKEEWSFDKEKSQLNVKIVGLAPVIYGKDNEGKIRSKRELFWIYFPECKYVLQNYFIQSTEADSSNISYADIFKKRLFSSYIYREDNLNCR